MKKFQLPAPAKVNLYLQIHGKRPDGYHELSTVMHTLELADTLVFSESRGGLKVTCSHPGLPQGPGNLVYRAASVLAKKVKQPPDVHIHILKRIPVAAGMGGGSSDAATALLGLAQWWRIPDKKILLPIAKTLGSDVAFFLRGGCGLGTGRGEKVRPWPAIPGIRVAIVNPGFEVSTAEMYKKFRLRLTRKKPCINMMRLALKEKNLTKIGENLYNDLESVTVKLFPGIANIKQELLANGASAVLMTGSGPTVFGLLPDVASARRVQNTLGGRYRTVIVTRTSGG